MKSKCISLSSEAAIESLCIAWSRSKNGLVPGLLRVELAMQNMNKKKIMLKRRWKSKISGGAWKLLQLMSYRMEGGWGSSRQATVNMTIRRPIHFCNSLCSTGELVWCRHYLNVNLTRFIVLLVKRATACRQAKTTRWRTKLIQSCLKGIKIFRVYYFTGQTN